MCAESEELKRFLDKTWQVFHIDPDSRESVNSESVVDFFKQSDRYHAFDLAGGAIHWALNFDGVFRKGGYYEQARIVGKSVRELGAKRVLEFGSGRGFNSVILARREPSVEFIGIDLIPLHVSQAQETAQQISNVRFHVGDSQALGMAAGTFDLVFDVDSIEYATDARLALTEAYRVLRPDGRFVLFDHFRKPGFEQREVDVQTASKLVERALAYCQLWVVDTWLAVAREIGFTEIEVRDLSDATMPHLKTLQTFARAFFKYPRLARAILRFVPPLTLGSLVAGLLMPFTVRAGAHGYYMIVLGRPRESEG